MRDRRRRDCRGWWFWSGPCGQHRSDQGGRKCHKRVLGSLAKRQIDPLPAEQRMLAVSERGDTVKDQARRPTPDHDVSVLQTIAHRLVRALQAAPEEGRREPQGHRNNRRVIILLIAVLMQRQPRAWLG